MCFVESAQPANTDPWAELEAGTGRSGGPARGGSMADDALFGGASEGKVGGSGTDYFGAAKDAFGNIPSDVFNTFGDKPSVQDKSQMAGTIAQAEARGYGPQINDAVAGFVGGQGQTPHQGYAPPEPPAYNPQEPAYNPAEHDALDEGYGGVDRGYSPPDYVDRSYSPPDMPATGTTGGTAPGGRENLGGYDKGSTPSQEAAHSGMTPSGENNPHGGGDGGGGNGGGGGGGGGDTSAGSGTAGAGQSGEGGQWGKGTVHTGDDGDADLDEPVDGQVHENEAVLNRHATKGLGKKFLMAANKEFAAKDADPAAILKKLAAMLGKD